MFTNCDASCVLIVLCRKRFETRSQTSTLATSLAPTRERGSRQRKSTLIRTQVTRRKVPVPLVLKERGQRYVFTNCDTSCVLIVFCRKRSKAILELRSTIWEMSGTSRRAGNIRHHQTIGECTLSPCNYIDLTVMPLCDHAQCWPNARAQALLCYGWSSLKLETPSKTSSNCWWHRSRWPYKSVLNSEGSKKNHLCASKLWKG